MTSCPLCNGSGLLAARTVRDQAVSKIGSVFPCPCSTDSVLPGGARDSGDEDRLVQGLSLVGSKAVAGLPGGMESRGLTNDRVKQPAGHRLTGGVA